jgi:glutathione S-transferase
MSYAASTLQGARHRGVDRAIEIWRIAEQRLGDRDWVLGAYVIADIPSFSPFLAPQWHVRPGGWHSP